MLPALHFTLMLLSLEKYKASRFILISLPSEIGIYVEEMGKQTVLRMSCYVLISLLFMMFLQEFRESTSSQSIFLRYKKYFTSFTKSKPHLLFRLLQVHYIQWKMTTSPSGHTLQMILVQMKQIFTPDLLSAHRVARYRSGGTTQVANDLQDRFVVVLTDSQSTILP